jgi:hemoglobin
MRSRSSLDALRSALSFRAPVGALFTAAVLAVAAHTGGCAGKKPPPPVEPQVTETVSDAGADEGVPPQKPLFERLGGKEGVAKLVDVFLANMQIDPKLKQAFAKTTGPKADHFKQMLVELICQETGGECTYSGKSMKDAHAGMKITDDQWNAAIEDLTGAVDELNAQNVFKLDENDKGELFYVFRKLKDDVVTVKKKDDKKK